MSNEAGGIMEQAMREAFAAKYPEDSALLAITAVTNKFIIEAIEARKTFAKFASGYHAARASIATPQKNDGYEQDVNKAVRAAKRWAKEIPEITDFSPRSAIDTLATLVLQMRDKQATPQPQSVQERELLEKAIKAIKRKIVSEPMNDFYKGENNGLRRAIDSVAALIIEPLSAATGTEEVSSNERNNWNAKQWAEHVGAWENEQGQVCFGSWMALRAMLIQFSQTLHSAATGGQESEAQAVAWCKEYGDPLYSSQAGMVCKPVAEVIEDGFQRKGILYHQSCPVGTQLFLAPPSALAIETCALRKAAEVCMPSKPAHDEDYEHGYVDGMNWCREQILATIHQDGITELERLLSECQKQTLLEAVAMVANKITYGPPLGTDMAATIHDELRRMAEGERE